MYGGEGDDGRERTDGGASIRDGEKEGDERWDGKRASGLAARFQRENRVRHG